MNTLMIKKLIDFIFCLVLVGLLFISIHWIWINEQKSFIGLPFFSLLGLPFITIHFVFLGLAKTQFGSLGKRLSKKHIGPELLLVGAILTIMGTLFQYFF